MEAIYAGPNGDAWKKSRIQIYGWEDFSWNLSTSQQHFARTEREFSGSFTICVQTVSNKTSSSSISNAFLTKTKPTTSIGDSAFQAFTDLIIDS